MNKIKFGEIKIGNVAKQHIQECLDSNWVTMGKKTAMFEEGIRRLFKVPTSVAVNSGTSADQAMVMALYDFGASRGDEIICPALSFISTGTSILAAGFKPVFVDVDWDMQIDVTKIEEKITGKTRAIMPVCLMGKPYNVNKVREIADKHSLFILADCCESHGAMVDKKLIEEYADMCAYSFYSAHVVFSGQFGVITSKDKKYENILKSIRSHGRQVDSLYFDHVRLGYNFMPTDIHASIGLESLEEFHNNISIRRDNILTMTKLLYDIDDIEIVREEFNEFNSPHAFSLIIRPTSKFRINDLKSVLDKIGVEYKRNFGSIPGHTAFNFDSYAKEKYPRAEYIGDNGIHWACHRYMSKDEAVLIAETVRKFFGRL
jgi:dTDP-4-amino-4,6-dideoxygalactose transaminase